MLTTQSSKRLVKLKNKRNIYFSAKFIRGLEKYEMEQRQLLLLANTSQHNSLFMHMYRYRCMCMDMDMDMHVFSKYTEKVNNNYINPQS